MKDKMNRESLTRDLIKPPHHNLDMDKKAIPKGDTHPGTGINYLTGKVKDPSPGTMLGEGD